MQRVQRGEHLDSTQTKIQVVIGATVFLSTGSSATWQDRYPMSARERQFSRTGALPGERGGTQCQFRSAESQQFFPEKATLAA